MDNFIMWSQFPYDNVYNLDKTTFSDVTGFRYSDCECPDACLVKAYGAELSYAALSYLSVESLLKTNISDLSFKYHRALEMQQVDVSRMV